MSCDLFWCDLSSRNQWTKLLVSVYAYCYLKLTISITTNKLVHFGVISIGECEFRIPGWVSFYIVDSYLPPYHICLISK